VAPSTGIEREEFMGRKIKPGTQCYACPAPATSWDHCPPQVFFPPDSELRLNLIKVPSCEAHNESVSADDEYVFHVMTMPAENNDVGQRMMLTKAADAMKKHRDRRLQVFDKIVRVDRADGEWDPGLPIDRVRYDRVVIKIARGLYYEQSKYLRRLDGPFFVMSNMFRGRRQFDDGTTGVFTSPLVETVVGLSSLLDANGCTRKGSNPSVFYYQISPAPPDVVKLVFYGGVEVMVVSSPLVHEVATQSETR
jgi:hypothetical protein